MGNKSFSAEEIEQFKTDFNMDETELRRIYRRFKKLDTDRSGNITVEDFLGMPELATNPLLERVLSVFDEDHDHEVNLREFVRGLAIFSSKGSKEDKMRFAFKIYDIDNDGFIGTGELYQVLKMMVGPNLSDQQLQQIVDKTIIFADKDGDGKISFQEFCGVVGENSDDLDAKLTLNLFSNTVTPTNTTTTTTTKH